MRKSASGFYAEHFGGGVQAVAPEAVGIAYANGAGHKSVCSHSLSFCLKSRKNSSLKANSPDGAIMILPRSNRFVSQFFTNPGAYPRVLNSPSQNTIILG